MIRHALSAVNFCTNAPKYTIFALPQRVNKLDNQNHARARRAKAPAKTYATGLFVGAAPAPEVICRGAEVVDGGGAEAVVTLTGAVVTNVVGAVVGTVVGGGGARVVVDGTAVAVDW